MKLTGRTARRASAVTGAICAAILIPAVALAAPATPARTATPGGTARTGAAAVPKCTTANLSAWIGIPGDGSAGAIQYQLELSNISARACALSGYPGVSAFGPHGQLGSAASRNPSHPVTTVVLRHGGTAHVELAITDVGVFSRGACHPVTAEGLKVFPPNDFIAVRIPFSFRACSQRGPVYLHVSAAVAGTGIPGFSS